MVDTNVFNHALDGKIPTNAFAGRRLLVTGIQAAELGATQKPPGRREALLAALAQVMPAQAPASSFTFDVDGAGWDQAYWNDGSGNFEKMLERIRQLDRAGKKKPKPLNQVRDILIAETAIKNHAILVSGDSNLRRVVSEFGGRALTPAELEDEPRP